METLSTAWYKNRILGKALIVGILVLLLMIPAYFVQNLITEREARQREAFTEISGKWAGKQNIGGPLLVLPYQEVTYDQKNNKSITRKLAYFLPDKLDIKSVVRPEKRYRGIYEVMLYSSVLNISGKFSPLPLLQLKLSNADILWNEAYVCMGINDSKGLKEEVLLSWNNTNLLLNPSYINNAVLKDGFMAPLSFSQADALNEIRFTTKITLNGSSQLLFTPVGKETSIQLESTWPDPSFSGGQLPETSSIQHSGFTAKWKSLAHTRNFPQAWKDATYDLNGSSFGVDLFIPVNGYQKTMRSVKYAVLCIVLTFAAFFLIETVNRRSVHPFQYALIGLALILFYTLLLSFSEYIGFNASYVIASLATVGLIAWFVKGLLDSVKLSTLLSVVLILMYGYVFTILQLQDYALLLGSIGLFIMLGVIMHFSKRIQW